MSDEITLHDVAAQMGVTLTNHQAWSAGAIVRERWVKAMGHDPRKDNAVKKMGVGSHCFAHYPAWWRPVIQDAIWSVHPDQSPQKDLFR